MDGFSQTLQMPDFQSNSNIDKSEINDNTQTELITNKAIYVIKMVCY